MERAAYSFENALSLRESRTSRAARRGISRVASHIWGNQTTGLSIYRLLTHFEDRSWTTPARSKVKQTVREYRWLWRLLCSYAVSNGSRDGLEYRVAVFENPHALPA